LRKSAHSGFRGTVCVGPVMLRNHTRQPRGGLPSLLQPIDFRPVRRPRRWAEMPDPQGIHPQFVAPSIIAPDTVTPGRANPLCRLRRATNIAPDHGRVTHSGTLRGPSDARCAPHCGIDRFANRDRCPISPRPLGALRPRAARAITSTSPHAQTCGVDEAARHQHRGPTD
jgi:hypothetical protein